MTLEQSILCIWLLHFTYLTVWEFSWLIQLQYFEGLPWAKNVYLPLIGTPYNLQCTSEIRRTVWVTTLLRAKRVYLSNGFKTDNCMWWYVLKASRFQYPGCKKQLVQPPGQEPKDVMQCLHLYILTVRYINIVHSGIKSFKWLICLRGICSWLLHQWRYQPKAIGCWASEHIHKIFLLSIINI